MTSTVLTLISAIPGGLDKNAENRAAQMLKGLGVERLRVAALAPGRAADVFFDGDNAELRARILQAARGWDGFDVFVQADDRFRKKKLLVADMDATIVQGETLDELADRFGLKDQVAPVTAMAMRGELDFAEALRARVALLAGRSMAEVFRVLEDLRYTPGAEALVRTMNRHGAKCILVSGGFDLFTARVALTLGFWKDFGNRLGVHGDALTGEVLPPIIDKNFKKKTLEAEARALGLDPRHVMAVGDGANDIPMLQAAGAGVGYHAKPAVQEATPHQVRCTDLTALLYMQGYGESEIVK